MTEALTGTYRRGIEKGGKINLLIQTDTISIWKVIFLYFWSDNNSNLDKIILEHMIEALTGTQSGGQRPDR